MNNHDLENKYFGSYAKTLILRHGWNNITHVIVRVMNHLILMLLMLDNLKKHNSPIKLAKIRGFF
jgi:hypothetical protein